MIGVRMSKRRQVKQLTKKTRAIGHLLRRCWLLTGGAASTSFGFRLGP